MLSMNREEFIKTLETVPPKPEDMAAIMELNRGHRHGTHS